MTDSSAINAEMIRSKVVEVVGAVTFLQRRGQDLLDALNTLATPTREGDQTLLAEALQLLEYVTWHDGRYNQDSNSDWQRDAQKLVLRLATRLNVEAYKEYKSC